MHGRASNIFHTLFTPRQKKWEESGRLRSIALRPSPFPAHCETCPESLPPSRCTPRRAVPLSRAAPPRPMIPSKAGGSYHPAPSWWGTRRRRVSPGPGYLAKRSTLLCRRRSELNRSSPPHQPPHQTRPRCHYVPVHYLFRTDPSLLRLPNDTAPRSRARSPLRYPPPIPLPTRENALPWAAPLRRPVCNPSAPRRRTRQCGASPRSGSAPRRATPRRAERLRRCSECSGSRSAWERRCNPSP
mmetsp:Transcript_49519/g.149238  ORF Transcript_49519/g.149238 Transcript_49519/m.149238 type:complete len:243 (-) Transcript_49519:712-1440(-)